MQQYWLGWQAQSLAAPPSPRPPHLARLAPVVEGVVAALLEQDAGLLQVEAGLAQVEAHQLAGGVRGVVSLLAGDHALVEGEPPGRVSFFFCVCMQKNRPSVVLCTKIALPITPFPKTLL